MLGGMLTVLLSTATASLFGVADFFGGVASRRASALAVTALAHSVGLVLFALSLAVMPAPFSRAALLAGAAAGVSGGIGVAALYAALARGRMSLVAPITAAISGSLPALYDFATGATLAPTAIAGLVLALVATVIVSATSVDEPGGAPGLPLAALGLSLLAGVGFAGSFLSFSFAGDGSGFWPLAAARLVSVVMIGSLALVRSAGRPDFSADAWRPTLLAGLLDACANVTMLAAIRIGPLAIASVIGSLYPVGTVLLARVVLKEHLHGWQRLGIGLALAAVVLAAWPR